MRARILLSQLSALPCSLVEQRLARQRGADDEDRGREVDQTEVADRVEAPRVVGGEGDGEPDYRGRDRRDPRPQLAAANAEPGERGGRETGGGDEAGHGDVEVADVVVEVVVECLDLVLAARHLIGADPKLKEAVGEVED